MDNRFSKAFVSRENFAFHLYLAKKTQLVFSQSNNMYK